MRAVDDLLRSVRSGISSGNFTLLFLWTKFWSTGGGACMAEMDAFIQGWQALSDTDALVLGAVVDQLRNP
jgi:hypothetical protein